MFPFGLSRNTSGKFEKMLLLSKIVVEATKYPESDLQSKRPLMFYVALRIYVLLISGLSSHSVPCLNYTHIILHSRAVPIIPFHDM